MRQHSGDAVSHGARHADPLELGHGAHDGSVDSPSPEDGQRGSGLGPDQPSPVLVDAVQDGLAYRQRHPGPGQNTTQSPTHNSTAEVCRAGASLRAGLALSDMSLHQLWVACLALGGDQGLDELRRYLSDQCGASPHEHDIVAQALNERCAELDLGYPATRADEIDT
jgi:hypothetical protein